jgi:hypothetical protein
LPTNICRKVQVDNYGNKWIATDGGLVEFNETGILSVEEAPAVSIISMRQNYPNPFSNQTVILIHLTKSSPVNLKLFTVDGKEVTTLLNAFLAAGNHYIPWISENYEPGIYIARLQAGDMILTIRMTLLD